MFLTELKTPQARGAFLRLVSLLLQGNFRWPSLLLLNAYKQELACYEGESELNQADLPQLCRYFSTPAERCIVFLNLLALLAAEGGETPLQKGFLQRIGQELSITEGVAGQCLSQLQLINGSDCSYFFD